MSRRRNLTIERARHEMSQKELAEAIGVRVNAVSRWERGLESPRGTNLVAMCELFGVDAGYLMEESDDGKGV